MWSFDEFSKNALLLLSNRNQKLLRSQTKKQKENRPANNQLRRNNNNGIQNEKGKKQSSGCNALEIVGDASVSIMRIIHPTQ